MIRESVSTQNLFHPSLMNFRILSHFNPSTYPHIRFQVSLAKGRLHQSVTVLMSYFYSYANTTCTEMTQKESKSLYELSITQHMEINCALHCNAHLFSIWTFLLLCHLHGPATVNHIREEVHKIHLSGEIWKTEGHFVQHVCSFIKESLWRFWWCLESYKKKVPV